MASVKRIYAHVNEEPAMAIVRKVFGQGKSFIIGLSAAYKYTDDEYLMAQAIKCAEVLGLTPIVKSEVVKICDVILEGLDDLVKMPPEEFETKKKTGVLEVRLNEDTFEVEV